MYGFPPADNLGVELAKLIIAKIGSGLSKILQWLAKANAASPPCHG
jgi:hypothetical protein